MSGQLGLLQNNVLGLSETVKNLKTEVGGMNKRLTNVTAQAVKNKCGIASINKSCQICKSQTQEKLVDRYLSQ